MSISKHINKIFYAIVFGIVIFSLFPFKVSAQAYGLDTNNYFCPEYSGYTRVSETPSSNFKCQYRLEGSNAIIFRNPILKPPPLQILQIWFVRILYVIWGSAGVIFAFVLIGIGLQYMFSFGNVDAVGKVISKFQKWLAGMALVFLTYPVLATVFQLLPLNTASCFSDLSLPAFQFFFPTACGSTCIRACEDRLEEQLSVGAGSYAVEAYSSCVATCNE